MKRPLKWIGFGLLGVLLLGALVATWAVTTEAGARFVLARAQAALGGALSIARSSGSLTGHLVLEDVRWNDPAAGVDARAKRVAADLTLRSLFARRVQIEQLAIDDVDVALTTVPATGEPPTPFSLEAPLDILIGKFALQRATITQDGAPLFVADRLDLSGGWTRSGIVVRQLALRAPDGSVDLNGTLATAGGYSGSGETTFRWRVDAVEYAGTLRSSSDGQRAQFALALNAPFAATLDATLGQERAQPWTITLDVPTFDPDRVLADSSLSTLALAVQGSGDRSQGRFTGEIVADGHRVLIDPAELSRGEGAFTIDTLTLKSPTENGSVHAQGTVRYADSPATATLTLDWQGVELPADLVGQVLATHGKLEVAGSAERYTAHGGLSIGPPGKPSDLTLRLAGTPQAIALETLALVQPDGGLDANGTITLQPAIGWQIEATANAFDPGAFVADWNGALDFVLGTRGTLTDDGPDATIKLERLGGTLRERKISGKADLALKPGYVVDGTLALASGDSTIELTGRGGNQTDVSARFNIAALGAWLPAAGGSAKGDFRVHGRWPALDVEGKANARDLAHAGTTVKSLELLASVTHIDKPAGAVTLKAIDVDSGEAHFDTLTIEADGNEASHQLTLDASGTPASLSLALAGSARDGNWQGTLKTLAIDPVMRNLQDFDLAQPARLAWDGQRFTFSESCLVGSTAPRARRNAGDANAAAEGDAAEPVAREPARLCIGGESGRDGTLAARYRLEHLPLRLIVRLAAPDTPMRMRGEIGGEGTINRSATGALSGGAHLASREGSASYASGGAQPLLSYTDFALDVQFAPQSTTATVRAALDHDGRLDGRVTLSGAPGSPQTLAGNVELVLNSLAFVELLSPEVANTKGRASANYAIGGTLAAPRLDGALTLSDFSTEVPAAGLKLHDGTLSLRGVDAQRFVLEGSIASGKGRLTIAGEGGLGTADPMKVSVKGEDFTAADIPAARVVVSPDLAIERGESGLLVTGKVLVPSANVDLARLPGGGVASTSPDVVVVDAKREEAGKPLPLTANVTVVLGDDVKLAGFGFDGTVGGQLVVTERPGRATTGTGTLNVGGTYKAYGQDLKIESGRVLFAGTAIDNPGIDIRASRKIETDEVTAGLLVRGTAQVPVLTVFSDPTMEQSNALSYLITGKPLSSLKSGEGDMLGAAARALGTAGGDLLAKSIGGRMGIDDIGVADNATLGGAAFTVGKFLSPKLYLSYGVGIFEPGEVVTLRYLFHKRWNFEAQNATTGSRAGINYRYER